MSVGTPYKESSLFIRETAEETFFPLYIVMCLCGVWSAISRCGMREARLNEINTQRREKASGEQRESTGHRLKPVLKPSNLWVSGYVSRCDLHFLSFAAKCILTDVQVITRKNFQRQQKARKSVR